MENAVLLYIMFFIGILAMVYTFMNIAKQEGFTWYKKLTLIKIRSGKR